MSIRVNAIGIAVLSVLAFFASAASTSVQDNSAYDLVQNTTEQVMDVVMAADEYVDYWIAEKSIDFIEQHAGDPKNSDADRPFFLWTGFCGPHGPFDPPEPYRSMYDPAQVPMPDDVPGWETWRGKWDEDLVRRCIAYYFAMMTCIDDEVGRLFDAMKKRGVYDNTLIVFLSDHGETLDSLPRRSDRATMKATSPSATEATR